MSILVNMADPNMADPEALLQDAATFATRAVQCDQAGLSDTAIFYYTVMNEIR